MGEKPLSFYSKAALLDGLADQRQPSKEMAKLVASVLMEDESLARYFFGRLDNPAWLQPLYALGVFKQPPHVVRMATDTGIEYRTPRWPAAAYLIRVAPIHPEIVGKIALEVDTDNASAFLDLIQAALRMPPSSAAQIVEAVAKWLSTSKLWVDMLADAAQQLMIYLADHEQAEAALSLLEALTEPEIEELPDEREEPRYLLREVRPRYRHWYLRKLIERKLPELSKLDPLEVIAVLETQLRKSIEMERRGVPGEDGSYIWRPAIEDHDQNWGHDDMKAILTLGLRNILERMVSDAPYTVEPIIERYLTDPFSVFRRLAVHLIRLGRKHYQELLLQVVKGRDFLDDIAVHHEFSLLVRECFQELPELSKKAFLDMVIAGPLMEGKAKVRPDELYREYWVLRRLYGVREHLMPPYDLLFRDLLDRFGKPDHPDFLAWHGPVWVGPTSPKDKAELAKMSAREVLEYLRTFEPSGEPFDHSRQGLARQLETVVRENPEEYARIAQDFIRTEIHSTYVYHLIRGFHEAWKDDKALDWEQFLALCEPISLALTDGAVKLVQAELQIDDIGWSGVRAAIARFFAGALQRDDRAPPVGLMPRIRDILLRFMRDLDPTAEEERERAKSFMDWVNIRINTTRGVTADALLEYALRYARLHKVEHEAVIDTGAHPDRFEPEMKGAFTDMLDKSKESSAAVHSIFGQYLPNFLYLDRDWTIANLDHIFPSDPEKTPYWEAAWEAYMLYSPRFYTGVYELLRPQYWQAVRVMAEGEMSKAMERAGHRLAHHLALAYGLSLESLEAVVPGAPMDLAKPEGSLLDAFLQSASDELRATVVRGLSSELRADRPIEDKDWRRLRQYWEARAISAGRLTPSRALDQELAAFSSWLEGVPEDLDSLLALLESTVDHLTQGHEANEVLNYLARQSDRYPRPAVALLRALLDREQTQDRIYLFGVEALIRTILQNALPSVETGRLEAISVVNVLGERGEYGYRDLLTSSTIQ